MKDNRVVGNPKRTVQLVVAYHTDGNRVLSESFEMSELDLHELVNYWGHTRVGDVSLGAVVPLKNLIDTARGLLRGIKRLPPTGFVRAD
jgi:hypothetical protein